MFYTIYKVINRKNNKKYIGKHITENINDDYLGSGILLKQAIKKHGKENFEKEILFVFDNEKDMNDKEKELINLSLVKSQEYYNISLGGYGGVTVLNKEHPLFETTCSKMSKIKLKKSKEISETVKKLHVEKRVGMYGKKQSDNQKQKVTEALKNQARFLCEFCGMRVIKGNYTKWHGAKCKQAIPFLGD